MPERKSRKIRPVKPVIDILPELLVRALARHDDFIVTCETDPDTGKKMIHYHFGKICHALHAAETDGPGRIAAG